MASSIAQAARIPERETPPSRRIGIGYTLGVSAFGFSYRHRFLPKLAALSTVHALWGRGHGVFSIGAQSEFSVLSGEQYQIYVCVPLQWRLEHQPTERQSNFGRDEAYIRRNRLMLGAGLGLEIFLAPRLSFFLDLPAALTWDLRHKIPKAQTISNTFSIYPAPNVGVVFYVR